MVRAMITCPAIGTAVPAGMSFGDLHTFDAAKLFNNRVGCLACRGVHIVDNDTVKAFPESDWGMDPNTRL